MYVHVVVRVWTFPRVCEQETNAMQAELNIHSV